jgi:hypothetical protein
MRIGLRLRPGHEQADAIRAESAGMFGVLVEPTDGSWAVAGAAVATATRFSRVIVRVRLGDDHPVTFAEDLAVLDNIAAGRVVALIDTADLDAEAAAEDMELIILCLGERPVRHRGRRWNVPAGIDGHEAPERIQVTPATVQVELPLWIDGAAAEQLSRRTGLPAVARSVAALDAARRVQPAAATVTGELEHDRALVNRWADGGATHLVLTADDPEAVVPNIARHLIPEAAMPSFPRIIAEALTPPPWPGPGRYVEVPPR